MLVRDGLTLASREIDALYRLTICVKLGSVAMIEILMALDEAWVRGALERSIRLIRCVGNQALDIRKNVPRRRDEPGLRPGIESIHCRTAGTKQGRCRQEKPESCDLPGPCRGGTLRLS